MIAGYMTKCSFTTMNEVVKEENMKSNLVGKKVRGTNAYGQAVGKLGKVISADVSQADKYGNYPIVVEYENGTKKNTMSFWVKVVNE